MVTNLVENAVAYSEPGARVTVSAKVLDADVEVSVTDRGVGNGVSVIIMIGIIARLPAAFFEELTSALSSAEGGGLIKFFIEIIAGGSFIALLIFFPAFFGASIGRWLTRRDQRKEQRRLDDESNRETSDRDDDTDR